VNQKVFLRGKENRFSHVFAKNNEYNMKRLNPIFTFRPMKRL